MSLSFSMSRPLSRTISRYIVGREGDSLETETIAFRDISGATDLTVINEIIAYLKAQYLYHLARFYPMKAAQNAGSGPILYGTGGLGVNQFSLINSPVWGPDGIVYNGSDQRGDLVKDWTASGAYTTFTRVAVDDATPPSAEYILTQFDFSTGNSFAIFNASAVNTWKSDDGTTDLERQISTTNQLSDGVMKCITAEFFNSSTATKIYVDNTLATTSQSGPLQPSCFDSSITIHSMCRKAGGSVTEHCAGTKSAMLIINAEVTTEQRETLTNLINAL